jgi:transposase
VYSLEFRKHVFSIKAKQNLSIIEVAKMFILSRDTVFRWTKNFEPCLARCKPTTKIDMDLLKRDVEKHPDSFQHERARRLNVSPSGIAWALKRLGVTYKKNPDASQGGSRKKNCVLPDHKGL